MIQQIKSDLQYLTDYTEMLRKEERIILNKYLRPGYVSIFQSGERLDVNSDIAAIGQKLLTAAFPNTSKSIINIAIARAQTLGFTTERFANAVLNVLDTVSSGFLTVSHIIDYDETFEVISGDSYNYRVTQKKEVDVWKPIGSMVRGDKYMVLFANVNDIELYHLVFPQSQIREKK